MTGRVVHTPRHHAERITDPIQHANVEGLLESFAWLRANAPVSLAEVDGFDPFWVVTRHADILEIERQPDIFVNAGPSQTLLPAATIAGLQAMPDELRMHALINMDGAEHRAHRRMIQSWFAPSNLKQRADAIRAIARAHVDRMLDGDGRCDFASDVALYYPLHVIMNIFGIPETDETKMLQLTQELFGANDPSLGRDADKMTDPATAAAVFISLYGDFARYFRSLSKDRRDAPGDDLASLIANGRIDGTPLSDQVVNGFYLLITTAGHDTTSASMSGALLALAERPDLFDRVRSDPTLIAGLVEEAVRWTSPVRHFMRTATRDYTIGDSTIRAGDWIMLSYLSANRDEAVFADPATFDIGRPPNRQLAFGYGPHVCIGQHLAMLEMRIFLEELLPRIDRLELTGAPSFSRTVFVGGPKSVPIAYGKAG